MVGIGLIFLVIGAISEWAVDNHIMVGNRSVDMDVIGGIFLVVGVLGIVIGLANTAMFANTSHTEVKRSFSDDDVHHDVIVDRVPDEKPKKVVRRTRKLR